MRNKLKAGLQAWQYLYLITRYIGFFTYAFLLSVYFGQLKVVA